MATIEVKVPDIGDFKDVPVISVMVKPGDTVAVDDPLVELEFDKATMEVPSPAAGKVEAIKVAEGDKVSEGVLLLLLAARRGRQRRGSGRSAAPARRRLRLRRGRQHRRQGAGHRRLQGRAGRSACW